MPLTRPKAREICTKPEMELVDASFAPRVNGLTPAKLREHAARARKLQDKYSDLARTQGRSAKADGSERRGREAGARTERKRRLFEETRERFEKRLERLEGEE